VYARLKQEIFEAVRHGRASSPVTMDEAKALPYLRAVMYEGLRMRAPTPGLFLKAAPPEGDRIAGKFIPARVGVGTNSSAVLASRELFGDNADTFRPERFLEISTARRADMERDVEVVFGYGRWMCMGKNIVWLELYKVLFEVSLTGCGQTSHWGRGLTGHSCFATLTFSLSVRPSLGSRSRGRCGSSRTFGS
jgi:cytochrome P450